MFKQKKHIPIKEVVLVTGAGGFLASHIIQRLQQDGYRVRGTVRSLTDSAKIAGIRNLAPQAKHKIELVVADLCHDEGWDQALSGCWAVLHVASPAASLTRQIDRDEFWEATLEGTKRVLKAAANAGVRKFVYTSSMAAVIAGPTPYPKEIITEDTWTDLTIPNLLPTEKCKALAEVAVWNFVKQMSEKERFDLTVLVPTGLLGPLVLKPTILTGTMEAMHMMFSRTLPGSPNIVVANSDVREVTEAHCKALVTPKASGQRILLHSECMLLVDHAKIVAKEFSPQGYSIYTNTLPSVVLWLPSLFSKRLAQSGIANKIGLSLNIDNSKMKEIFNIHPRPLSESILDMAYSLIDLDLMVREKKFRKAGSRTKTTPSTNNQPCDVSSCN